MRILSILYLATLLTAQQTPKQRYAEAIKALNTGRIPEAKSLLEKLLTDHPDYYRGYVVYWRAIAQTQNSEARKAAVEKDLKQFEQAPPDKRDEEFYSNFAAG